MGKTPRSVRHRRVAGNSSTAAPQSPKDGGASETQAVFTAIGELLDKLSALSIGASGESMTFGGVELLRVNSSIKKVTWVPSVDVIIVGVQKIVGSSGNLIVATQDLTSANITQFTAGAQVSSLIYADNAVSTTTDPIGGQMMRYLVRAGTRVTVWYETSAEGAVAIAYLYVNPPRLVTS